MKRFYKVVTQVADIMEHAIKEAIIAKEKGEVPIGAVVTYNNEIIACAHNQIIENNNPLAHAEIIAINKAMSKLSKKYLTDCSIYVTLEPCPMCAGAIVLARIKRLYIGTESDKTGACGSLYNIVQDSRLNSQTEVYYGIRELECRQLLSDFFEKLRQKDSMKNT